MGRRSWRGGSWVRIVEPEDPARKKVSECSPSPRSEWGRTSRDLGKGEGSANCPVQCKGTARTDILEFDLSRPVCMIRTNELPLAEELELGFEPPDEQHVSDRFETECERVLTEYRLARLQTEQQSTATLSTRKASRRRSQLCRSDAGVLCRSSLEVVRCPSQGLCEKQCRDQLHGPRS